MTTENTAAKSPEEKYEEAALELAVYRLLKEEQAALEEQPCDEETLRLAEDSLPRMLALIDRTERRVRRRARIRKGTLRTLKTAALVILVLNLGMTITCASSATVRAKVMNFMINVNNSYADIEFIPGDTEIDVPEDWLESYFPMYIPDGYSLCQYDSVPGFSWLEFTDEEGNMLEIKIHSAIGVGFTVLNTENSDISYITLHGAEVMVVKQPYKEVDLVWSLGDRYFIVAACDYDTAYKIAESIQIIG